MNRRQAIALMWVALLVSACAADSPALKDAQREFTFDFTVPDRSQSQLWYSARDYFAESYGDSRAVFRVMDEQNGTIIGTGLVKSDIAGQMCATEYHVRFAAKDNKARVQFELIEGIPAGSQCGGFAWPTKHGYVVIVESFNAAAKQLETALNGEGSSSTLKDF